MEAFSVFASMGITDVVCGPLQKMKSAFVSTGNEGNSFGNKMGAIAKKMLPIAVAAGIVVGGFGACIGATIETQSALGELASVGVKDMDALSLAAADFSNQWAGTTKSEFIAAAYDIKSGISSLTDAGVAQFTHLSALTGKATKSTTAEMTKLFALGHGIFSQDFVDDKAFGDQFSAAIASSVKRFRTDGSDLAQGMFSLGATAQTLGVSLAEEMAIIGMSKGAFNSASEGCTSYAAFLSGVVKAQDDLGLTFTKSNGKLLPMADILDQLKGKYGELSAVEINEISKAFGGQEATKIITAMIGKTTGLRDSIVGLNTDMSQGTVFTSKMAQTMNQDLGAVMDLNGQKWHNLKEIIGNVFLPVVTPLASCFGSLISLLQKIAGTKVGSFFIILAASVAVVVLAVTAFAGTVAAVSFVLPIMAGSLIPVIAGVWSFTVALLACPLTWIVVAVVAVGASLYWLYNKFDVVKAGVYSLLYALGFFVGVLYRVGKGFISALFHPITFIQALFWGAGEMLGALAGKFESVWPVIKGFGKMLLSIVFPPLAIAFYWDELKAGVTNMITWIKGLVPEFLASGKALWGALVSGIKSMVTAPVEAVKGGLQFVRNLLPFSDAKEGPLSTLTLSGQRMMETLAGGVQAAAPKLQKVAAGALAGVTAIIGVETTSLETANAGVQPVPQIVQSMTENIGVPAMPDLGGKASWTPENVGVPAMPDLGGTASWTPENVGVPAMPDLSGKAGSVSAPSIPGSQSATKHKLSEDKKDMAKNGDNTIHIHKIEVTLPSVQNADNFVKELQKLVEQYDA